MKYFSIILTISGLYLFVYACSDKPCTDDGCPDFGSETGTERVEYNNIEEWIENPAVESVSYQTINLEYGVHKVVEKTYSLPDINTSSNEQFVKSLNGCINYLYKSIEPEYQIPNELIIAQAAIETGWGKTRFANEGNNLFGIRTWNKDDNLLTTYTLDRMARVGCKSL